MGGKSYWCDYCECFMKNDINVRHNHNSGTAHNIAKANYLQTIKDPKQIVQEEKLKMPCKKVSNGLECPFGFFCRFSHYSPEDMTLLQSIVYKNESKNKKTSNETTSLPWYIKKSRKRLTKQPPPSLQPIDFEKIDYSCFQSQWG